MHMPVARIDYRVGAPVSHPHSLSNLQIETGELRAATSLSDVAEILDFKPKAVSYILYKQPAATSTQLFRFPNVAADSERSRRLSIR